GAFAGAAAAVGDAEGFVEVEVADIRADVGGAAEADLGVHVGSVHVDLAAELMRHLANGFDVFFEDAVGGGVGDHQGGEVVFVLLGFAAEVGEIDVALVVAIDGDDFEAGDDSGGGVGAVGAGGDETYIADRVLR